MLLLIALVGFFVGMVLSYYSGGELIPVNEPLDDVLDKVRHTSRVLFVITRMWFHS